jgi:hypothetical protein
MAEMELYTLGDDFLPRKMLEPYISAIWTERYSAAGDMEVVVLAPSILADELSRGRYVAMRGSKEIMQVETRTIENGLLTAKGPSLLKFFNEREAWFENPDFKTGEKLPVPSPTLVNVYDFSGPSPLTVTIPTPADEAFDGRTVVYVVKMMLPGTPTINHSNPVTAVGVYSWTASVSGFTISWEAWRLKQASDLTFTLKDIANGAGYTTVTRVFVLRGLRPPDVSGWANANFSGGYTTNPPAIAAASGGTWPAGHRWIALTAYKRTVISGHSVPAGGVIDGGSSWTDDHEIDAPTGTTGVSLRLRSAHDFTGSAAGVRPAATFHPSVEWTDPPLDQGVTVIFDLDTDDAQLILPENSDTPLYADYTVDSMQIGEFLATVVNDLLIDPTDFGAPYTSINFDWADEKISGLALGDVDGNGILKRLTFPVGPIYDTIAKLAEEQHIGIKLYLESATEGSGFVLKFASYRGVDRTSVLDVNRLIRMSPDMDSLLGSKEFFSLENYKNVVYVTYKNRVSMHYLGTVEPLGFNRRVIRVDGDKDVAADKVAAYRTEVAWNALLEHQQTLAVDGQVQTVSLHKFGKDYYLGDMIEIQGNDGLISIAQVIEHIRSQDQTGFKEYPTLSVIDPVLFDFDNDLGGVVGDQDWYGDPAYTIDE